MRRWLLKRRLRAERYGWGGSAWTDPIPTWPRIQGNFAAWPWRLWSIADVIPCNRMPKDMLAVHSGGDTVLLRADRSGQWAEVRPL